MEDHKVIVYQQLKGRVILERVRKRVYQHVYGLNANIEYCLYSFGLFYSSLCRVTYNHSSCFGDCLSQIKL